MVDEETAQRLWMLERRLEQHVAERERLERRVAQLEQQLHAARRGT